MAQLKNTNIDDVGFIQMPTGTSGQRPDPPEEGYIRFNTDINKVEFYDGEWKTFDKLVTSSSTGARIKYITEGGVPYKVHIFEGAGTFTVTTPGEIEYLVVGGGGGGGSAHSTNGVGGGGAGGFLTGKTNVTNQTYNITIGNGGTGASNQGNGGTNGGGTDGGDSSIIGTGLNITAVGGGLGRTDGGNDGGSGGGAGTYSSGATRAHSGGTATPGQGNPGGNTFGVSGDGGAGGGGAGGVGGDSNSTRGGDGGPGLASSITGVTRFYAGGGGGSMWETGQAGYGGIGGGGNGITREQGTNANGAANSGGGGGGSKNRVQDVAGTGGSGIVVIRHVEREPQKTQKTQIVSDSLSLYLDAADPRSFTYGGSSFPWNNLAGVTGNGVISGTPVYSNQGEGWIDFTSISCNCGNDIIPVTGPFSVGFLYQLIGNSGRGGLFERQQAPPYNGMSLGQGGTNNWAFNVQDGTNTLSLNWTYPSLNTWYFDIGTFNGYNTINIYRNGAFVDSSNSAVISNLETSGDRGPFLIANRDGISNLPCRVAAVLVYTDEIGPLEVEQNWNALRERFGI